MVTNDKVRIAIRKKFHAEVTFSTDADSITANSTDLSETGIKFETDAPIIMRMNIDMEDGTCEERKAELVWAQKEDDGRTTCGLHFIDNETQPE